MNILQDFSNGLTLKMKALLQSKISSNCLTLQMKAL